MNKLLPLTFIVTLSVGSAYAADWTPYLSSIKHNCDVEKIHSTLLTQSFANKKLPQALHADLVKRTGKINPDSASGEVVLQLKNATAFGQPLTKISYMVGDSQAEWHFYFANDGFMKLLPTFYTGEGKHTKPAGTQHFWLLEFKYADDNTFKIVRNHNRPYKDAGKWWDDEPNITSSDDEHLIKGYQTTKTGYVFGTNFANTTLSFNPQAKTISCTSFYS